MQAEAPQVQHRSRTGPGFPGRAPADRTEAVGEGATGHAALPSVADLVYLIGIVVALLFVGNTMLSGDGDTARHLRLGEYMLERGELLSSYPFTFSVADKPFLPFEWGSEVLFALLHRLGGLGAVAGFTTIIVALAPFGVMVFLRRRGVDTVLALITGLFAIAFAAIYWVARPHIFTLLGAVLLLPLLEPRGRGRSWLAIPLFAVWANLHGGFVYGLLLIGMYTAGEGIDWWISGRRRDELGSIRYYGLLLAAAAAGTLINPHGWQLHRHIVDFFANGDFLMAATSEFQSPDFHLAYMKLVLGVLLLAMCALAISRWRIRLPRLIVIVVSFAFLLVAQRNIPLFGLVALPILALHLDTEWRLLRLPGLNRMRSTLHRGDAGSSVGIWSSAIALGVIGTVLLQQDRADFAIVPNRFDAEEFPVAAVEQARTAGLRGPIFNQFVWGGYLIHAWPEEQVFIDGGTDYYGADVFRTYLDVITLQPGWREVLASREISLVLVPGDSPLANELAREPDWTLSYCDDTAVILQRISSRNESQPSARLGDGCPPNILALLAEPSL